MDLVGAIEERVHALAALTERPEVQSKLRVAGRVAAATILALFAFGTVMLATMLWFGFVVAGVLALALWPAVLDTVARRSRFVHVVAIAPVAVVVPVFGLLGVDVLWASAHGPRPHPAVGLVIAGVVVFAVAYGYLRWVDKPPPPNHGAWAVFAFVVAVALLALTSGEAPALKLIVTAAAAGVATVIYLARAVGPQLKRPLWWALLLVGVAVVAVPLLVEAIQGHRTSPVLLIVGAIIAAFAGLNGLWLRTGSEGRMLARRLVRIGLVFGVALPLVVVVFVEAASIAPGAQEEKELPAAAAGAPSQAAVDHHPILLFDGDERFRTPLDVDAMFETGDVQLCPEGNGLLADCRTVERASDLRNGFGNLRFDSQEIQDDDLPTTIYAHEVPDRLHAGWTDIDYWWYLPDNPANTALGAMCGAGLVIPEITCFDHQSDWEGITVVVDAGKQPVAVHYAAHDHVISVPWATLQAAVGKELRAFVGQRDVANHPLVFVARGTHAAYPLPCKSSTCNGNSAFEDNRHDGEHVWPEEECSGRRCVTAFPRTADGKRDASWNAFDGHWGSAICVEKIYCARSDAPKAPGTQGRYKRPWCFDYEVRGSLRTAPREVKPVPQGCETKK
jgi:hypothetical protein